MDPDERSPASTAGAAFELLAAIALVGLLTTAIVVAVVPKSTATRGELAIDLAVIGIGLAALALLLGRTVVRALVERPVEVPGPERPGGDTGTSR